MSTPAAAVLPFTEDDVGDVLPEQYLARAYAYLDRVGAIDISPDGRRLSAPVRGTQKSPYRVDIIVTPHRGGDPDIDGDCSCPVGYNCKHVGAVLLAALARQAGARTGATARATPRPAFKPAAPAPDPLLDGWLRRLAAAGQAAAPAPADIPDRLLYIVDLDTRYRQPYLVVDLTVARLLKAGGYGKPKRYTGSTYNPPRYVTETDLKLLRWLDVLRPVTAHPGHGTALSGTDGARLLADLLASGRCHWRSPDNPALTLGAVRAATPGWQVHADGGQTIAAFDPDRRPIVVLPLTPPWYFDPTRNLCGPLDTGLPDDLAGALFAAPRLAPAQVGQARAALSTRLAPDSPALPRAPKPERREVVAPVPQLTLTQASLPVRYEYQRRLGGPRLDTALARLEFDYAGVRVGWQEAGVDRTRLDGDTVVRMPRDLDAEQAAALVLAEWGFIPADETGLFNQLPLAHRDNWAHPDTDDELLNFAAEGVASLRDQGWRIDIDPGFPYRFAPTDGDWYADVAESSGQDWFGLKLGIMVDGTPVNLLPVLLDWLRSLPAAARERAALPDGSTLVARMPDGRLLPIPMARARAILDVLLELHGEQPLDAHGRLRLAPVQAAALAELDGALGDTLAWSGGAKLRELGAKLKDFQGIQPVPPPAGLNAELRPYQRAGLDWMQFLREFGFGGVLADDMGLGKTVQTLAHLLVEKAAGRMDRPSLVVAPTSLMANWRREAARFAPALKLLTLHGTGRHAEFERINDHDLVLTTYPLLPRDAESLAAQEFHYLILDEAQVVKNPKAKASQVLRTLHARHRLCLTGTPMENHLGELWSLFHFLMPGLLGDERRFRALFRTPIEKHGDAERRAALRRRVAPFMLRRTKQQVAADLPPKTEIVRAVELDGPQRDLYESIRLAMDEKVRQAVASQGLARSHIVILDALLKLRQACNDPRLLKIAAAKKVKHSAKLELLMDMLPELIEEGRRILLFSQFTSMLALIEDELKERGIDYVLLTGDTRDRDTPIERFQSGQVPLFLISLKAGGTGLNLTAADTVIHYDPWWNPAVERQATDRAHRIGQDKPVFVYKLITTGTVEERIAAMQARKQALADGVYGEGAEAGPALSAEDLEALLRPLG